MVSVQTLAIPFLVGGEQQRSPNGRDGPPDHGSKAREW